MKCVYCGAAITDKNIALARRISGCPACGAEFDLYGDKPKLKKQEFIQPSNLIVSKNDDSISIEVVKSQRDTRESLIGLVAFAGAILGFYILLNQSLNKHILIMLFKYVLLFLFWMLVYFGLAKIFNSEKIILDSYHLKFKVQPIPTPDNCTFKRAEVDAVEVRRVFVGSKGSLTFNIYAILKDGTTKLFIASQNRDPAYFIAQELNKVLCAEESESAFESQPASDEIMYSAKQKRDDQ